MKNAEDVPLILIGNKSDLEERRSVRRDEAADKASKWGKSYIETSAKTRENVDKVTTNRHIKWNKWSLIWHCSDLNYLYSVCKGVLRSDARDQGAQTGREQQAICQQEGQEEEAKVRGPVEIAKSSFFSPAALLVKYIFVTLLFLLCCCCLLRCWYNKLVLCSLSLLVYLFVLRRRTRRRRANN